MAVFTGNANPGLAQDIARNLMQPLGRALEHIERRRPGRRHPPLNLRLGDDIGGVDEGRGGGRRHHTARLRNEPASVVYHADPFA